jgi:hypothetical protein
MVHLLIALAGTLALVAPARADEPLPGVYDQVEIAPTKTSIYIGSVSMTMPPFAHRPGGYASTYVAKVFPYFFYNERGRLEIDVSDDQLRQLAQGETIHFQGRGVNEDGEERHVEGRAVPADALSGHIKVRVFVTKKIQLIFNTTYRFAGPHPATEPQTD